MPEFENVAKDGPGINRFEFAYFTEIYYPWSCSRGSQRMRSLNANTSFLGMISKADK